MKCIKNKDNDLILIKDIRHMSLSYNGCYQQEGEWTLLLNNWFDLCSDKSEKKIKQKQAELMKLLGWESIEVFK